MTFLKNPVGEKSVGRIFFVYKIPKEKIPFGYKVASSLVKRVSWLKFEPRSRIFPIKIHKNGFLFMQQRKFFLLEFYKSINVNLQMYNFTHSIHLSNGMIHP